MPADALYGIQTVRAVENLGLGGRQLGDCRQLVVALAHVKAAAAQANRDVGVLEPTIAEAIMTAAREVAAGGFDEAFPVEIVQGGGGTSTNMNMNEVLANRANELLGASLGAYHPVHPNDHVNRSQSTNDVVPTAVSIAVFAAVEAATVAVATVADALVEKAKGYDGFDLLGRTCLRDAVPVPIPAFHRAQAETVTAAIADLSQAASRLLDVPLGGTAVGTGLGAPEGFAERAIDYLRSESGLAVRAAPDRFSAMSSLEPLAAVADSMARAGRALARIAGDFRLLASGPAGGFGELLLPALQPGSSIMPGKVNPVLPELVMQVSFDLAGSAHTVALATAAGELQVAVMGPIVADKLLAGSVQLARVAELFAKRCIAGMEWDRERVRRNLEQGSFERAVQAVSEVGYQQAASLQSRRGEGDE